jgi:hypothetical protein
MECCTDQEWQGNWDPFVRLCFQFGMLLGVDEFQQDLGYHLCKHRLGQRLCSGWGLVWGTGIVDPIDFDPDPAEKKANLTVGPLFAIDELGRELWVKEPCTIDLFKWAQENALPDDTPLYVTISYRSCCVAPVPAVAAPCDDSSSATMPSRVIESVECELWLDPPDDPIDLSDLAPSASDTLPIRFQTLVDLIRNDARRPLLLGTVSRATIAGGDQDWTVSPNLRLPRIPAFGGEAMRVVEAAIDGTNLRVKFSRTPSYAPAGAFQVYQLAGSTLTQLVTAASTVTPDAGDPSTLRIGLSPGAPTDGYRIEIAGTGPSAVLFMTATGPAPLNEGRNYTRWGMP